MFDENDVNTYFLENRVELASFYHEQSVIHAQDAAFRAGALSNLVNHKLKFGSFKNNAEIRATALALREALESINPTSSPETPWPRSAHFSLALLHNEVGDVEAYYATIQEMLYTEPTNGLALMNLGNYYFNSRDFINASIWYDRSLAYLTEPKQVTTRVLALNNCGQSLRELSLFSEARIKFLEAFLLVWMEPGVASALARVPDRALDARVFSSRCKTTELPFNSKDIM